MKTHLFLYTRILAALLATTPGCGTKHTSDGQTNAAPGSATIRLTQNGQAITTYTTTGATGVGGEGYLLDITSLDGNHALSLSIQGESAGTYPFINPSQTLSNGKANFLFQSTALPETYAGTSGTLLPNAGDVMLTSATKTRCAGTFRGSGQNAKDGKTYTLEGTFDATVVN